MILDVLAAGTIRLQRGKQARSEIDRTLGPSWSGGAAAFNVFRSRHLGHSKFATPFHRQLIFQ